MDYTELITIDGYAAQQRTWKLPSKVYAPNIRAVSEIRLLTQDTTSLRRFIKSVATRFIIASNLGKFAPRHDVMDHCLPLIESLNVSHVHEVFAGLTRQVAKNLIDRRETKYTEDVLEELIRGRAEHHNDFDPELYQDYLVQNSPIVWDSSVRFYTDLGVEATRTFWLVACTMQIEAQANTVALERLNAYHADSSILYDLCE